MRNNFRFRLFILFFCFLMISLFLRTFYMQVVQRKFYEEKSTNQLVKSIRIYPHRGRIFDRNFRPLAITKSCYAVYGFPKQIKQKELFIRTAAPLLEMSEDELRQKLYSRSSFVWIKRKASPNSYKTLRALKIKGIEFFKEDERIYPNGRLAAHVLGYVGIDNQGLGGLEYLFDRFLKGAPGKIMIEGDPLGKRMITGYKKTVDDAYDGGYIKTTLDRTIQYFTEKHLKHGIDENMASGGVAIVMDPSNGDILAWASFPNFDPHCWYNVESGIRKNKGIVDVYEPGSVFKLVTIAAALDEKIVKPSDVFFVPDTLELGGKLIKEAHKRPAGESQYRSVSEILEKSLNVGTTIIAKKLGEERLFAYIEKFGFGSKTGIELPGESRGLVRHYKQWSDSDIGRISFGQGIAVTPIQMVRAISAIVNKGEMVKPRIIEHVSYHDQLSIKASPRTSMGSVITKKTSQEAVKIMVHTVERGTGVLGKLPGFWVGGKTGTAQKPNLQSGGYLSGSYVASFVGFFPAYSPKFVILVVVDNPKKTIYGSSVAGPIFRKIGLDLISYHNIPPERPVSRNIYSLK